MANINVTVSNPAVSVNSNTSAVTVSQTTSNIVVGTATSVSTATIRSALSANTPISYSNVTGIIGLDSTAPITQSNKISANTFLSNAGASVFEINDTGVGTFNELKTYGSGLTLNTNRSNVTGTANIIAQGGQGVHPTYNYAEGGSLRYNPTVLGSSSAGGTKLGRWEFNNDTGNATVWTPLAFNTDDLPPGSTNQYYTTAKANTAIQTYFGDSGNFPFTFNGNLTVNGNIDYVNVNDLLVNDQSITLNYGNATARDAFIYVDRSGSALANAALKWNEATDTWQFSNDGTTFKDFDSLADATTDDLAEGNVNLYFSNTNLATSSTTHLPEGTNLYFTNARVAPALVSSNVQLQRYQETAVQNGNVSGNVSFNLGSGTIHDCTLIADITGISFANVSKGSSATIILRQDVIGSRSLDTTTYPSNWTNFNFANDDSVLDGNSGAIDVLNMFYDGTTYFSSLTHLDSIGIPNSALANSNIIINNQTFELGSSGNINNFPANVNIDGRLQVNADVNPNQIYNPTNFYGDVTLNGPDLLLIGGSNINASSGNISAGTLKNTASHGLRLTSTIANVTVTAGTGKNIFLNSNTYITQGGTKLFTNNIDGINGNINLATGSAGLVFSTNSTERMFIDSLGNVTMGNPSAVFGLRNLKYDYSNNRLGLGTGDNVGKTADGSGAFGPLHILSDNSTTARINMEELRNSNSGPDFRFYKGRGSYSSPATVSAGDRLKEELYYAHDGTDYGSSRARMSIFADDRSGTGYDQANGIITASHEFGVNATDGSTNLAAMQIQGGTGDVLFGLNGLRNTGTANASISRSGTITANYFSGDAGGLSNIAGATNSFGIVSVVGQSNVVADIPTDQISFVAGAGMILTTDAGNDSITFQSTGGYGDSNVISLLGSYTNDISSNANITITGDSIFVGDINGAIQQEVRNETGVTINRGKAVYLTGAATGDVPHVALADNTNVSLMPALGIVKNNIANATVGEVVTSGALNIGTHGLTLGADLFVNGTGDLTTTKPTGQNNLLQKIGKVINSTQILVQGAFRTNAVPNLDNGNIFIGDGSNEASTAYIGSLTYPIGTTGNVDFTGSQTNISRLSTGRDNIGLDNGFSNFPDLQCIGEGSGSQDRYLQSWQFNRSGSFGGTLMFVKGRGTVASPSNASIRDRIVEFDYYGHNPNGTGFSTYINNAGYHVYHDSAPQPNDVPLAHEFWVNPPGGASSSQERSILALRSDRTITFNDTSLRGDDAGTGNGGNANITQDGTFNTVSNVNATGTIYAGSMTPDDITLKSFQETVVNLGNITGDISSSINANSGSIFTGTATGNITFSSIANVSVGSSFTVKITQDGTGSRLLTSTMKFAGGDKTLSTGAGNVDVISVVYDGTDYLASLTKDYK